MWHIWRRRDLNTGFGKGSMQKRELLEDLGIDGNITLKLLLNKYDGRAVTIKIWLRVLISGSLP